MNTSQHVQYQAYPQPAYPPGGNPYGYPADRLAYLNGGPVGFGEAIRQANRNRFTYRGRASRSAYWWFHGLFGTIIGVVLVSFLLASAASAGSGRPHTHATASAGALGLALLLFLALSLWFYWLPALALSVRRVHDTGRSGWWLLLGLVPFVGGPILAWFLWPKGTLGPNRYDFGDG